MSSVELDTYQEDLIQTKRSEHTEATHVCVSMFPCLVSFYSNKFPFPC